MSWELGRICCNEGRRWALTTHQWATLTYLALMANMETSECKPTMGAIAETTKQTKKSAIMRVRDLEKLGYLKVVHTKGGNGGSNTYKVLVDNFAKGEPRTPLKDAPQNSRVNAIHPKGEPRVNAIHPKGERHDPLRVNTVHPLGGTIGGVERFKAERVSKLVGADPHAKKVVNNVGKHVDKSGQNQPPEELLVKHGKSVLEIAPSARYDAKKIMDGIESRRSDEEYLKLMREPGWKPQTRADRLACSMRCYAFGASREQALKFVSYNAVHRWAACDMASINDLAHMWVASWRRESPDEWRAEQARRRYEEASRTID